MHAPPKDTSVPVLTNPAKLAEYDGFLAGIPTRYGNFPAQWKAFWDRTGSQWQTGAYWGKYVGVFISTGTVSHRTFHGHQFCLHALAKKRAVSRFHVHFGYIMLTPMFSLEAVKSPLPLPQCRPSPTMA